MRSLRGAVPGTPAVEARLADVYTRFWAEHDISPTFLHPQPTVDPVSGHILLDRTDSTLSPYLGERDVSPGMFNATAFPLYDHWPWAGLDPARVSGPLATYLDELFRVYVDHGWQDDGYFYVYDEPRTREEHYTETLAQIAHRVSARFGFRAKVLVTDWPRRTAVAGRPANAFLFDSVDVWCPSVYHFFDCLPELQRRRDAGSETWWYTYASHDLTRYPTFLIDEPLAKERAVPWLSWRWGATGFLYWGATRWGDGVTGEGYRDPYLDTASYAGANGWVANGEASLVYPGYEPRLGLTDPYAAPVSSLRLEALRDGIEDLRVSEAGQRDAAATPRRALRRRRARSVSPPPSATTATAPTRGSYLNIPRFAADGRTFSAARSHLADATSNERAAGQTPVTVAARRDASGRHRRPSPAPR